MDSKIDSLFDQYERGKLTRRHFVQVLAAMMVPANAIADTASASAPLVHALCVHHIGLNVADVERSYQFYNKLFGTKKGWLANDAGTGIHLDLAESGYISVDKSPKPGVITHFSIGVEKLDMEIGKRMTDDINAALPGCDAKTYFQNNTGGTTVNLKDPDGIYVQISQKSTL
jgi:catechol 2,3-dioxygenase-like lactoylglutathione lyase family enzyme